VDPTRRTEAPLPLATVCANSAGVVANTAPWLHRRVEKISYSGQPLVRRTVSIDFTVPAALQPFASVTDGKCIYYAPVALLRKWPPLLRLDLRDEDGHPVPLLTSDKNREVDAAVLSAIAPDGELKHAVRRELAGIPHSDRREARELLNSLGDAVTPAMAEGVSMDARVGWWRTLVLAGDLVLNSILWFRVQAYPGQRQVVKFGFDEPQESVTGIRAPLTSLGWVPDRKLFSIPHLGDGGSYHVQFEPPPGLVVQTVNFKIRHPWDEAEDPLSMNPVRQVWGALIRGVRAKWHGLTGKRAPVLTHPDAPPAPGEPFVWNAGDRAYLYVSGRRKHLGVANFDLAADSRAFPAAALIAGVAITALMSLFAEAAGAALSPKRLDAAVTVLLLVPGLLAYLVVRPNEHPLLAARLRGVRRLVVVTGGLPVVAAVTLLVAGPSAGSLSPHFWTALALVASFFTALLAISWLLPGPAYPEG
jgi:hypothetical protein